MKMTIVTDSAGHIIGAVQGYAMTEKKGEVEVGVTFPHGHKLHHVEVADDMVNITDPAEFNSRLSQHLPKP
jgi:hypothetical protein